jgi:hypothetical protein
MRRNVISFVVGTAILPPVQKLALLASLKVLKKSLKTTPFRGHFLKTGAPQAHPQLLTANC